MRNEPQNQSDPPPDIDVCAHFIPILREGASFGWGVNVFCPLVEHRPDAECREEDSACCYDKHEEGLSGRIQFLDVHPKNRCGKADGDEYENQDCDCNTVQQSLARPCPGSSNVRILTRLLSSIASFDCLMDSLDSRRLKWPTCSCSSSRICCSNCEASFSR